MHKHGLFLMLSGFSLASRTLSFCALQFLLSRVSEGASCYYSKDVQQHFTYGILSL